MNNPLIVAVEMGYGHLRAAHALAEAIDTPVWDAAQPPLVQEEERKTWQRSRRIYEFISRTSQVPVIGRPFRGLLNAATFIPELHPYRDLSASNWIVNRLNRSIEKGMGLGLVNKLNQEKRPLLSTFYLPALAAAHHGYPEVHCVITDADIHRIWVAPDPKKSKVQYCVPSQRAFRRLMSYGVPKERIQFTGFPLPPSLLGGPDLPVLRSNLASRLRRLDPQGVFFDQYRDELKYFLEESSFTQTHQAPLLTFAVGGAGAQSGFVRDFLPALRSMLLEGQLRLALVAGLRQELVGSFRELIRKNQLDSLLGKEIEILYEPDFANYYSSFNRLLARTDILWTKPSELTFYAALGIPIIFSWPVGHHEKCNRRWAIESGAGLKQGKPKYANHWIHDWLSDGTLAGAAWCGFMRLPKFGVYRILESLNSPRNAEAVL